MKQCENYTRSHCCVAVDSAFHDNSLSVNRFKLKLEAMVRLGRFVRRRECVLFSMVSALGSIYIQSSNVRICLFT